MARREAASRLPRRPRRAARALYARFRRCRQRCGPRWTPARACGGRHGPLEPTAALRSRPDSARSARVGGAAAALWRRCGLRQRGERHTLSRRRFGREALAACRHQKVKSSQVKSVLACTAAVRSVAPRAPRAGNSGARGSRCRCRGRRRRGREGGPSSRCRLRRSRAPQWHLRGEQAAVSARRPGPDGRWVRAVAAAAHLPTRRESSRSPAAH